MYTGVGRRVPLGRYGGGLGQTIDPDLLAYYRDILQVHIGPRPFVPGYGEFASVEVLPEFFRATFGTERPPLGSPPGATGVVKMGPIWTWWFGPSPQAGSAASYSFRSIPPAQPGSFPSPTVENLFPELIEEVVVDVTATEDYQRVLEQQRQPATGLQPGDVVLVNGKIQEVTTEGTYRPVSEEVRRQYQTDAPSSDGAYVPSPGTQVPVPRTQAPTIRFPSGERDGEAGGAGGVLTAGGGLGRPGLLLAGLSLLFLVLVPGKRAQGKGRR